MVRQIGTFRGRTSIVFLALLVSACSNILPSTVRSNARVTPATDVTRALTHLPEPRSKIAVAVYGLRDQTGQYRSSPDSPYSTAVTQGAATMLVEALRESGWYLPVEREGLQNLLTERRIVRAIESPTDKGKPVVNLPNLMPASMIIEGGITAYESNVRTGGKGLSLLGVGADTQYRVDQVTVGLRSVDIRSGQVLNAVAVTKTIYSFKIDAQAYRFISYKHLLQGETGFTTNEPAQLAVREAIEAAVVHLTARGVRDRFFELKDDRDWNNPVLQSYLKEDQNNLTGEVPIDEDEEGNSVPMQALNGENVSPIRPLQASANEGLLAPSEGAGNSARASAPDPALSPRMSDNRSAATPSASLPAQTALPASQSTTAAPPAKASGVAAAGGNNSGDDIFNLYWRQKR